MFARNLGRLQISQKVVFVSWSSSEGLNYFNSNGSGVEFFRTLHITDKYIKWPGIWCLVVPGDAL
jgi:hypothetical protein